MKKEWILKNPSPETVRSLELALGVSPLLAGLLVNRGVSAAGPAKRFLAPDLSHLHNPFLLPEMEKAVVRAKRAVDRGEKILVYGDRDADGVTSIALLVRTLKSLGAQVQWTVPTTEGYGLHKEILAKFAAGGTRLVITVDCGVTAVQEIAFANASGLDVIVTDHHLPGAELPPALAVVNPNRRDSLYPMKALSGCGTAYKFAAALMSAYGSHFNRDCVVVDLETTGLASPPHEIVEIGAVRVRNFVPLETFSALIRPPFPIPEEATQVHGITDDMVENAPPLSDVLPRFLDFVGKRPVVAHNARFDLGFIRAAVARQTGASFDNEVIDTLALARRSFTLPSHALDFLSREFGLERARAHRALDDCLATLEVFRRAELEKDPRLKAFLEEHLDLAALGTIGDVVPLLDENRAIAGLGLARISRSRKAGVKKLLEFAGVSAGGEKERAPTGREISWSVVPLINAAGRLGQPDLPVRLLLAERESEAEEILGRIARLNGERKTLQKTNTDKFLELAREQCDLARDRLLFVVAEGLSHGVTGIAANQLLELFHRPVVLLILEGEEAGGSCRSLPGFNIVEALAGCGDLLARYGGHAAAAGLSVRRENIEALRQKLKTIAAEALAGEIRVPLEIDGEIAPESVTAEFLAEIRRMEPFGHENPAPLFALKDVRVGSCASFGEGRAHLRLRLPQEGRSSVEAVGWRMAPLLEWVSEGARVHLACQIDSSRWKGEENLRLLISDAVPAAVSETIINEEAT